MEKRFDMVRRGGRGGESQSFLEELAGSSGIRVYFITKIYPPGKGQARWLRSLFGNVAGGEEV